MSNDARDTTDESPANPLPVTDDANPSRVKALERDPANGSPEGFDHPLDHYLAIHRDDLIAEAASRRTSDERRVTEPLAKALWAREAWLVIYPDERSPFARE